MARSHAICLVVLLLVSGGLTAEPKRAADHDDASPVEDVLPTYVVRTAIVIPSDAELPAGAHDALHTLITDIQDFYADQMERHGYGRITFQHEVDQDSGMYRLHVVRSNKTREELSRGTRREHHDRLIDEAIAGGCEIDHPGQSWLLLGESWDQASDGSLTGIVALGIRGRRDGNENNGVCVRTGPVLQAVAEGAMQDDSWLAGTIWAALGPHELSTESVQYYIHGTRSGVTSSMVGSVAHELGHCFGLLHVYDNDGMWCGDRSDDRSCVHYGVLMGNGLRAWRSRSESSVFSTAETPEFIGLAKASADLLSLSPYFGRSDPESDPTRPDLLQPATISFDEQARTVRVRARAIDEQSGIALVHLYNGRETVWSRLYEDRPVELAIDIETDRMPSRGSGRWRLRIFNGAFQERQIWLDETPPGAVGAGLGVHIIQLDDAAFIGSSRTFRARILRLPRSDELSSIVWSVNGVPVGHASELEHRFEQAGVHELAVSVRTRDGLNAISSMRVYVDPRAHD